MRLALPKLFSSTPSFATSGPDRIRAMAIFGIIFGATPAVAPLLGGYIHVSFGWRANFVLVTLAALCALMLVLRFLPESSEPDAHAIKWSELSQGYMGLLKDPVFVGYALLTGTSLGFVFGFLTAGPFIFINNFQVATEDFGLYYFFLVASYMLGNFCINRLAHRVSPGAALWAGVSFSMSGALMFIGLVQTGYESPVTLTVAMCLIFFGSGPVFAVAPAQALDATENRVGYASALLGFAELVVGAVAAAAITVMHDGTSMPLAATLVGLAGSAGLILLSIQRLQRQRAGH